MMRRSQQAGPFGVAIVVLFVGVLGVLCAPCGAQVVGLKDTAPVTLTIDSVRGEPGAVVYVNVSLDTGGNEVSTVLLGLAYEDSMIVAVEAIPGQTIEDAGKEVGFAWPEAGVFKFIVFGGVEAIRDGFLVALKFEILDSAGDAAVPLEVAEVSAASPGGDSLEVEVAGGYVLVGDVSGVVVSPVSSEVHVGDTVRLSVEAIEADGAVFIWTSNMPGVASVSMQGVVTALSEGQATITATHAQSGASAQATVVVAKPRLAAPTHVRVSEGDRGPLV
ncbi:MAG TPA: hypothetical protein ENN80_00170, partial [Candidatus Hydrogenedentes bacterium]|nr:hypothetical protein [Candidatus Hydrogenedentota bacterium]